jgi:FKBP-type peptidyl-prolyl cis-trans isomerase
MQKTLCITLILLTAASLAPNSVAQQAPPAKTQPAAPPKSPQGTTTKRSPAAKAAPLTLKTQKEKASYAMGMNFGTGLRKQSIDIDPAILARGLRDSFSNGKTLLTEDEARVVLTQLQSDLRKKQQEMAQQAAEANKKQGLAFLEANKTKDGVVALPSGLEYKVLQEGTGPKPAPTDTVVCNYRGTLLDNTEFDSSYKHGQPATFPVTKVIKGWTEALQLMPVGSKWQLFVPAELAYGEQGAGGQIGPNATLIFEVELLSIQGKDAK